MQENERKQSIRNEHGYRNDQDVIDYRMIAMISILEVKSVHVAHLEEMV
jgi:hypothetical protein